MGGLNFKKGEWDEIIKESDLDTKGTVNLFLQLILGFLSCVLRFTYEVN